MSKKQAEAYEAMLDWYYDWHKNAVNRFVFADYWAISVDQIDLGQIKESEMARCRGEACDGKWWVDDDYCHECERPLDGRTRTKTYYLIF